MGVGSRKSWVWDVEKNQGDVVTGKIQKYAAEEQRRQNGGGGGEGLTNKAEYM